MTEELLGIIFDWAGDLAWASDARTAINGLLNSGTNTYVSSIESVMTRTQTRLDTMMAGYDALD